MTQPNVIVFNSADVDKIPMLADNNTFTGTNTFSGAVVLNGALSGTSVKDEDNMASDSATAVPTQQSTKAYVDTHASDTSTHGVTTVAGLEEDQSFTGTNKFGDESNYLEIDNGGKLSLAGTAKYERHVQIPAMADGLPANQPAEVDFFTAGGLQFASSGTKYAYCQWEIPDDWDGTDIIFEVDWFPDSGAISGTDTIKWDVEYRAIAEGEAINNGTSVTVSVTDSEDYAQYVTKHSRFTLTYNNANQPLTKQYHVYFKVSRDTGVANDFAGTVTVTAYEIIYQSTGFTTSN